jgi:serine/threonine protein kinase
MSFTTPLYVHKDPLHYPFYHHFFPPFFFLAANLLLNNQGHLVIADLGTAVCFTPGQEGMVFSNKVVTLWYRAPELLLGACSYGPEIDMWSVGYVTLPQLK